MEKHRFWGGEIAPPIFTVFSDFVCFMFFLFFGAGDGKRAFQHGIVFRPNRNERYLLDRTGFDGIVFGIFFLDGELSCEVVETIGRTSSYAMQRLRH